MSAPLSVGLNLTHLISTAGGSGRYARELVPALLAIEPATRITAFVSAEAPADIRSAPWGDAVDWVRCPLKVSQGPPGNFAALMAWQWLGMGLEARRRRLDVVHGLANVTPLVSPGVATVCTLLDVIWLHHPETMEREATVGMRRVAPRSARAATRVIAISEAARRDLIETLGLAQEKVDVTPLGIRPHEGPPGTPEPELRSRLTIPAGPLVLCVAQKRAHKNLAALIRAFSELPERNAQLVIPGASTPHEEELRALAERLRMGERVHLLDWVSEADLDGLYRAATCFVLPSLEEGFGLPLLEAMSRDVPVACSNVSSLPEVTGDAALLFDPRDTLALRQALQRLITEPDLRRKLVERGRRRCRQFTWAETATQTLTSYRRAIADRSRSVR